MISTLAVAGYRSLRDLVVPLDRLTLVTGRNGAGKSNLYRALRLLADLATGGAALAVAREGGIPSIAWAGPERVSRGMREGTTPVQGTARRHPVSVRLGFGGDGLGYAVDLGLPTSTAGAGGAPSLFALDPEVKSEVVWFGDSPRPSTLVCERRRAVVRQRDAREWRALPHTVAPWQSILRELDVTASPEVAELRATLSAWRFYDSLRTDPSAPARQPHVGTRTRALANDGHDLASAVQTIREAGLSGFDDAVELALPGSRVEIVPADGRFSLSLRQHGLLRPLSAVELSDGTLRYLLLAAALASPDPSPLLVLNEPESSLHPDLFPALAELVARASSPAAGSSQIVVVSHAPGLVAALERAGALRHELVRDTGETRLDGQGLLDVPRWTWPAR